MPEEAYPSNLHIAGNYSRSLDVKTAIRVGVVGFPNVGKSSVINSLKRAQACDTGSVPGMTKQMQEVSRKTGRVDLQEDI